MVLLPKIIVRNYSYIFAPQQPWRCNNRPLLLKKLRIYGIRGQILNWAEDYFMSRRPYMKFNKEVSVEMDVKYGVALGRKLGPLLFILYINKLYEVSN